MNKTRNQHYVSQAEQRLNAVDRSAPKDKCKIFEFEVAREPEVRLGPPVCRKIRKALSCDDLFSFSVVDGTDLRENFECLFQRYEDDVRQSTEELLKSIQIRSVKFHTVRRVFRSKFINFLRNPHSAVKVVNSVGNAWAVRFTDPGLESVYRRVIAGNSETRRAACDKFGLTEDVYARWTRALFNLLEVPPQLGNSIHEQTVDHLFDKSFCHVLLNTYGESRPEHVCLLSDRGFNVRKQDDGYLMMDFNLTSKAYIQFAFLDLATAFPDIPSTIAEALTPNISIQHIHDNIDNLVAYNGLTAYQCARHVYAAHHSPLYHDHARSR